MKKEPNYPVTDNLRILIRESGRSQNQIALESGMTSQRLSDVMNGRGTIKACEILTIGRALGVPYAELFKTGKESEKDCKNIS